MRNSNGWWVIIGMMLLLDIYVFQVVRYLTQGAGDKVKLWVTIGYWTLSGLAILLMVLLPFMDVESWPKSVRSYVFATMVGLFFAKLIGTVFFLADDLRRGAMWVIGKIYNKPAVNVEQAQAGITRSVFLSWAGIGLGSMLFGSLMFGFRNKYRYRVETARLRFPELPESFSGLRIVHISDIHAGSFHDEAAVIKGVEMIMEQKPDLILFTGDLVNDKATEMDNWVSVFSKLKAPMGVYSTLGNHDYGDYVAWPDRDEKHKKKEAAAGARLMTPLQKANLEALKTLQAEMGWKLLMNEHVELERNGEKIALLGIENWGAKGNFPKYGKMELAHPGTAGIPFKILMSHDPSHWDAQVKTEYPDINLMLSGHTHGMQFGVELPGFQWSPVQFMYKQWGGLYGEGSQRLYVNRGFGFIGYPGRVGIMPEITVLELSRA